MNRALISGVAAAMAMLPLATLTKAQASQKEHPGVAHLQDLEKKFGPRFTTKLSSGGASAFRASRMISANGVHRTVARGTGIRAGADLVSSARSKLLATSHRNDDGRGNSGLIPVNEASFDYAGSRFSGFSQSETASAWCGDTIVAGFNDSSAWNHTVLLHEAQAISLSGVAVSHDRGKTFVGFPFLNPGPALDPGVPFFESEISGDPVVVCSSPQNFAYSSIRLEIPVDAQGNVIAAFAEMSVNRSSNGGLTWDDPIVAIKKDLNSHFLDKEWLALDPHNGNNLYLTYTDFQDPASQTDCPAGTPGIDPGPDVSLELVSSKDGGATWSQPVQFGRQCGLNLIQNLSGTQVAVGPQGQVYVAYAAIDGKDAQIKLRRSDDGGNTFGPDVVVGNSKTVSSLGFGQLQGNFRTTAFPSLAVDNSSTNSRGTVYLSWTDVRQPVLPDVYATFLGFDDGFSFGDIVFSISKDGGATWSDSKAVSPVPADFKGAGRDQFMSGIAVDPKGALAICYSDRRNDPNNFLVDHYCSVSTDQGGHFKDVRETAASWTPNAFTDGILNTEYMGDYDGVSTDSTGKNSGFFSTFQILTNMNPDVFGVKIRPGTN